MTRRPPKRSAAQVRQWRIFRLHGLDALCRGLLTGPREAAARQAIKEELERYTRQKDDTNA